MRLNRAVSERLKELLRQYNMTKYDLYVQSGVPKTTIANVLNCTYESVKLRIIRELCRGMGISVREFFQSPLFDEE